MKNDQQVAITKDLPQLPNWLPLSSQNAAQATANLTLMLNVAQKLFGANTGAH